MLLPPVKAKGKSGRKYFFLKRPLNVSLVKWKVASCLLEAWRWYLKIISFWHLLHLFHTLILQGFLSLFWLWLLASCQYHDFLQLHCIMDYTILISVKTPSVLLCALPSHPTGQGSSGSERDCSVMCLSRSLWTGGFRRVCKSWVAYFCCLSFGIQAENLIRWKRCHEKSCFLSAGRRIDARTCA